jgi:outer membrane protein assembly factor BamB
MRKTVISLVVIMLIVFSVGMVCFAGGLSTKSPWPTYRGDRLNSGRSKYAGPENPVVLMTAKLDGYGMAYNARVIGPDGTIYFISGDRGSYPGKIHAMSPEGEMLWTIETAISRTPQSGNVISSQGAGAISEDGLLYFQVGTELYCITPDGTVKWIYEMGYGAVNAASPAIGPDGTIYISGGEFGNGLWGIIAVNPDGTEKWRCTFWNQVYGTPALGPDGNVYVAAHRRIYCVNPEDGTVIWESADTSQINQIVMLDDDGNSYLCVSPNMVISYDTEGQRRWFALLIGGRIMEARPALSPDGSTLYVGSHGDGARFHAIDTSNGKVKWNLDLGGNVRASATVDVNGIIYIAHGAKVYAINPDGTIKWDIDIPIGNANASSIAIGKNGEIYGMTDNGVFIIGEAK